MCWNWQKKVNVSEKKPRICSILGKQIDLTLILKTQYFLRTVSILLVDHVVSGLASRFDTYNNCLPWVCSCSFKSSTY